MTNTEIFSSQQILGVASAFLLKIIFNFFNFSYHELFGLNKMGAEPVTFLWY